MARDRLYTRPALGVSAAGHSHETVLRVQLALRLRERRDDAAAASAAALHELPDPSLPALHATHRHGPIQEGDTS